MKPTLIYCYDAYCGWCYGFSPVMKKIAGEFGDRLEFEVLSGGMITGELVQPIARVAGYIKIEIKKVEELTGIKFGEDFLWHINHPEESDWRLNSEKPAIALCIFKEYFPEKQIEFASDLQFALNYEGRDLDDDEAYRHLLDKYSIVAEAFYDKLNSEEYKELAFEEFELCRQLQVTGFPQVLVQTGESKFRVIARGFTPYEEIKVTLLGACNEIIA